MNANFSVTDISNATLFLYQCVDPPPDSCDFGPCPNPDVTGIGQQISIYITATVFAITITHDPRSIKVSAYTFLANLLSLLIAALISLFHGELTQNDAAFVIVVAVSPASLYIWIISFGYLINLVPMRIASRLPSYRERLLLVSLSLLSLALWVVLLILSVVPVHSVNFSQPACNQTYGMNATWMMKWSVSFLGTSAIRVLFISASWTISRKFSTQNIYRDCIPLLDWTRINFRRRFSRMAAARYGIAAVLLLMQISPTIMAFSADTADTSVKKLSAALSASYTIRYGVEFVVTAILALTFIWVHTVRVRNLKSIYYSITSTVGILIAAVCAAPLFPGPIKVSSFGALIIGGFLIALSIQECRDSLSHVPKEARKERNGKLVSCFLKSLVCLLSMFSASIVSPQCAWLALWQPPAVWPSNSRLETMDLAWRYLIDAAPVFKFTYFVLQPTIAWIEASTTANPTNSSEMTFGQVFSLITAAVSLVSLVPLLYKKRIRIVTAIWPVRYRSVREGLYAPWVIGRVVGLPSREW